MIVIHYDGTEYINPEPGHGYDAHNGVDYGLSYRPVRAGAEGNVANAGWHQPQNHQFGLGLHVVIDHNNGYQTEY